MEFPLTHRFSEQEQLDAQNTLLAMAQPHIEAADGRIAPIKIDLAASPGQDMNTTFVEGNPQPAALVESIATDVDPRFPEMIAMLEADPAKLETIGEMLKRGNNVIIATNHSDLIDIALALAAVYCALQKKGYEFKTGIVVSKMVAFIGYKIKGNVAPAVDMLQLVCDEVHLTFPRTESAKKSRIKQFFSRDNIDKYNEKATNEIDKKQAEGKLLLAIAPSGSTDKEDEDNPATKIMFGIGRGTSKILSDEKTFTQFMSISLGEKLVLEFVGIPRALENEEEAHNRMDEVAERLSDTTGTEYNYRREHHSKKLGETAIKS